MKSTNELSQLARKLRLHNTYLNIENMVFRAQEEKPTYIEFLEQVLRAEVNSRKQKDYEKRLKSAKLPLQHDLDEFDYNFSPGISRTQMQELRELVWVDNRYNLILMGPSGTGKTYIASGLIYDALKRGRKAYMLTMQNLISIIKMKDISPTALRAYTRLIKAEVLAIDDIMLLPIKKEDAVGFFNLINMLHGNTSIIITTNKAPTEWVQALDDEVLATALLDRLLYHCEVIKLRGSSYRMENRKTIFNNDKEGNG
ncbi:IS21-like element helper ATPase IstB [Chryseobacterium sp.]|uniref:IS21-like element helper ATPase IstB n=1 Tax=Chryseobacterium sp. TaxID=1871047 RepID=UPI002FC72B66